MMTKAQQTILSVLRCGEETEDHVRVECLKRGISDAEREVAIGDLLDAGLVLPTLIQVDELGFRNWWFVAALRRVA